MTATYADIRASLDRLHTAKHRPPVFGAEAHGFVLNPPLSESTLRSFEVKHGVRLPADYRGFLSEVGDG